MTQRIAAITGAAGFIGSHVAAAFAAAGWRVRAMARYNSAASAGWLAELPAGSVEIAFGDVRDARCVAELVRGADAVCHLAALIGIPYSYRAPESYIDTNVRGTLNVLEACREARVPRVLVTSTSEVYGTALRVPIGEDHPLQAQSPYSASKIAADALAESYHRSFGLPVVTVRPFNTYGPRQSLRAIIPTIAAQALSPDCDAVRLGALDPVRDLTYAADTAEAFRVLAESPADAVVGRVFNLGTGEAVSVGELAARILAIAGSSKPVAADPARIRPAASEVQRLVSDNARILAATDWRPRTRLDEGLRLTVDWVRANLHRFRAGEYTV